MSYFKIYSSSAGSGKTFTLTKEYLKIVLQQSNPKYFKRILAMTFTNEAADEMKKRIVKELKSLCKGEKTPMLNELLKEINNEETLIQSRAQKILYEILQDYNDFAIKTIDSFVNQIVGSFTFDLDLPYNYDIILNPEPLLTEAVRNLIDRIGHEEGLADMFQSFALSKVDDDKSWNTLEEDIVKFSKILFNDEYTELIEKNNQLDYEDISVINKNIKAYLDQFVEKAETTVSKIFDLLDKSGLEVGDFAYTSGGIYGFWAKMKNNAREELRKVEDRKRVHDAINEDKWYSKSKEKEIKAKIDEIKEDLRQHTSKILSLFTEKYRILDAIYSNLFKIPFLTKIKNEIVALQSERNQVVLSSFNQLILNIVSREPVPYIYERIGEKYNHILLDEFQDTSDIQFFNILPLFENTISKGYTNLIVGDPKQAIYSWRGGNVLLMIDLINKTKDYFENNTPEIQLPQLDVLNHSSETFELKRNWRSEEEIISFNNNFFNHVIEKSDSTFVKQVFSSYKQEVPENKPNGGYVKLSRLEGNNVEERQESVAEELPKLINELLSEGFEHSDIAILCRKGNEGSFIAETLKLQGFPVKSSDSLKLENNLEVKFLVAALKFFVRPEMQFEKFEFLEFFFRVKNIDTTNIDLNEICNLDTGSYINFYKNYDINVEDLDGMQVYTILEHLTDRFNLFKNETATEYVLTFLDFAFDFNNKNSQNIADFLLHWEVKKETMSISLKADDAITVQTIHKAKGLEYPIVILPFASWRIELKGDMWANLENLNFEELKVDDKQLSAAPFRYTQVFDFNKSYIDYKNDLSLVENLNLLYVAMTRAVERQYIWIWGKPGKNNIGYYLNDFLNSTAEEVEIVFGEKKQKKHEKINVSQKYKPNLTAIRGIKQKLKPIFENESILSGNIIHDIFEHIHYHTDTEPVLQKFKSGVKSEEFDYIASKVREVTNHPELKDLFNLNTITKNEIEILSSDLSAKRPDRITFLDDKVYVIDYKSGEKHNSHKRQLEEYGNLLTQMGYQNIHLKLVYLDPLEVIKLS